MHRKEGRGDLVFFVPSILLVTISRMMHERVKIVSVSDPFVMSHTKLREHFGAAYDDPLLVIDLSGVHLVDGRFLDELARLRSHRQERGLQLVRLVIDSPYVRSALSAVAFDRNWPIFRTIGAALNSFEGPPLYT